MKIKNGDQFRILIVDDIPRNIQVLGNILRNQSYQMGFATDGEQALKMLEKHQFDLILLDVMMPGIDGYEVCKRIRECEETKDIPVIFLTAKVEKESIVKGFKIGAQDYLTKPFNADELLARVSTQLELSNKRKQLADLNQHLEEKVKERTVELQKANDALESANKKLEQLEKAKGDFLTIISHELRTPMNGILGFADILRSTIRDKEQLEYLGYLFESANNLTRFADVALIIAQLSADRYKLKFKEVKLKDVLETAVQKLDKKIKEKGLEINFDCPHTAATYKCDVELLEIAFGNVIENAIKYSPEKESIVICEEKADKKLWLKITDKGEGFSDEALNKLFEYFSADKVMHHHDGFGLGLSAAKLILKAHGGDVHVKNLNEGGTEVCFEMTNFD